jgi:hypothetical protein
MRPVCVLCSHAFIKKLFTQRAPKPPTSMAQVIARNQPNHAYQVPIVLVQGPVRSSLFCLRKA